MQDLAKALAVDPESLPRFREPREASAPVQGSRSGEDQKREVLEKRLLRLLLEPSPEAAMERDKLDADDFSQENCREFYKLLDYAWENHIDIRTKEFQQRAEQAGLEGFAAEISLISIPPGNPGRRGHCPEMGHQLRCRGHGHRVHLSFR